MPAVSFQGLLIVAGVAFLVPLLLGLSPARRLPPVVLEIAAGIVIGPSVLGWVRVDLPISYSLLTPPYRLKRFQSLSPNSKPVSSQRREDERREVGRDESVGSGFRLHGNGHDPVSEKRAEVPLAHR